MIEAGNLKYVLEVTWIQKSRPKDVKTNSTWPSESTRPLNDRRSNSDVFEARFARCHETLHFLAYRVLGSPERVHEVVEKCRITASRNPPTFEYEGAFRSWLVRILIDEALVILRQRNESYGAGA
jgi:DNA-directed RNA polymerase specialized sigma24 family protein